MAKIPQSSIDIIRERDKTAYFKTPIRFPIEIEQDLRAAANQAGRSFNNFVVSATCRAAGLPEPVLKEPGRKKKKQSEAAPAEKLHEGSDS